MFAVRSRATHALFAGVAVCGLSLASGSALAQQPMPGTPAVVDPRAENLPDVALASRKMEIPTTSTVGGVITIGQQEIERKGWRIGRRYTPKRTPGHR